MSGSQAVVDLEVVDLEVVDGVMPLTEACKHYTNASQMSYERKKYFFQRRNLFPSYDDARYDIRLTDDGWFGVTPQAVAYRIARDMPSTSASPLVLPAAESGCNKRRKVPASAHARSSRRELVVVDLFAGVGGNTIAFANSPDKYSRVIAIERDPTTLACAQHNAAQLCDDPKRITWLRGDCFEFLDLLRRAHHLPVQVPAAPGPCLSKQPTATAAAGPAGSCPPALLELVRPLEPSSTILFGSPPWGGPSYLDQPIFDLVTMEPYGIRKLHYSCAPWAHALYLPRTSDLRQISALVPAQHKDKIDVIQYHMKGACKALVAYFPPERQPKEPDVVSVPLAATAGQQAGRKRKFG